MRTFVAVPAWALVAVGLVGCAQSTTVCPAVGYYSAAQITLTEPRDGLTLLLCDGEDCEPGPVMRAEGVSPAQGPDAVPLKETGVSGLTGDSSRGWSADFIGGQPTVGYRLIDATGVPVSEGSVAVDWVRVGGSDQCGGPREAQIELPA